MDREAYERQYQLGYQRGSMDSEAKLGQVVDELIVMQTEIKDWRRSIQDDKSAHELITSIEARLISLIGP
jgi:flagellar biosynthesis/type III secretory pathway protein FliH